MSNPTIYQLKITLKRAKPPIWRRIQLSGDTLLPDLHKIIQATMGWTNSHLHQFIHQRMFFGPPDPMGMMDLEDYRKIKVSDLLQKEKAKMSYEYDFGDGWEHEVLLEKILEKDPKVKYPVCLKGKNACPPEDCGGVWGYADLVQVMQDPQHEEHEEMKEWLGGELDPEAFDLDEVNRRLRSKNYGMYSFF